MFLSTHHQKLNIISSSRILLIWLLCLFLASRTVLAQTQEETRPLFASAEELASFDQDKNDNILKPYIEAKIFSNPEVWYKQKLGSFTWILPLAVDAVAVEIATSSENRPNNNPDSIYETPIDKFLVTPDQLIEGVQYLSLRFRVDKQWGEILNYKIMIDTVPPKPFRIIPAITRDNGDFPIIHFATTDETSGIDYYLVTVADQKPIKFVASQAFAGYKLAGLEDGIYQIQVVAYDHAGNMTVSSTSIPITAGWTKKTVIVSTTPADYLTRNNLIILALIIFVVCLLIIMYFEQKFINLKEQKLRYEIAEAQTQTLKIFSALRDEIYNQINSITSKKRLSKKEKEVIVGLNQTLEVSKSLINKEINAVDKILK